MKKVKYDYYEYNRKRDIASGITILFHRVNKAYVNKEALKGKSLRYFLRRFINIR